MGSGGGTPTPGSSAALRRRAAAELGALALLAALYLALVPERPAGVDAALAGLALAAVGLTARATRARFWAGPAAPARGWTAALLGASLAVALGFAALGARSAGPARLLAPTVGLTFLLFLPWAWLQQALLQFYLLGRVRALLPGARPLAPAAVNGALFAAVHLPDGELAALTWLAGFVWSRYYLACRRLGPLALSHALLGTAYFAGVRGEDLLARWLA